MKVIRAVRTSQGNVVQKMPAGGVGRLKCPRCNGVCTAKNMPNGKRVLTCTGPCGGSYVVSALSNPRMPQPGAVQPTVRTTHHPARPAASPTPRIR